MNEEALVRAFVTVYANTQHWRGQYKPIPADCARAAADEVATSVLGLEHGTLIALANTIQRSPYNVDSRIEWIDAATTLLVKEIAPLVTS
jgi:hypothetical protein